MGCIQRLSSQDADVATGKLFILLLKLLIFRKVALAPVDTGFSRIKELKIHGR
jgi:hypothetical protein